MPKNRTPRTPDQKKVSEALAKFVETISALRHPVSGCPWDNQQDFKSLRRYMLEEAYEACEAMTNSDADAVKNELGDVLLQVVLNAQIALDEGKFSLDDVIKKIDEKMRRRHPHVFGEMKISTADAVRSNWEKIKEAEQSSKNAKTLTEHFAPAKSINPASRQAAQIGKLATKISFDWTAPSDVLKQFKSECLELDAALTESKFNNTENVQNEIGDVYFTLCQLCRHLNIDPEVAAWNGNHKFLKRVEQMDKLDPEAIRADPVRLEELWSLAKQRQNQKD